MTVTSSNCDIPLSHAFLYPGMHPLGNHVCEWEEGVAHGSQQLLWGRERFHHAAGRRKENTLTPDPFEAFHRTTCPAIIITTGPLRYNFNFLPDIQHIFISDSAGP